MVDAFTASISSLPATILSLLYVVNQKKDEFNLNDKMFDPWICNRRRTKRDSIR
jgi:hypothetical protein